VTPSRPARVRLRPHPSSTGDRTRGANDRSSSGVRPARRAGATGSRAPWPERPAACGTRPGGARSRPRAGGTARTRRPSGWVPRDRGPGRGRSPGACIRPPRTGAGAVGRDASTSFECASIHIILPAASAPGGRSAEPCREVRRPSACCHGRTRSSRPVAPGGWKRNGPSRGDGRERVGAFERPEHRGPERGDAPAERFGGYGVSRDGSTAASRGRRAAGGASLPPGTARGPATQQIRRGSDPLPARRFLFQSDVGRLRGQADPTRPRAPSCGRAGADRERASGAAGGGREASKRGRPEPDPRGLVRPSVGIDPIVDR
jgi:hypothetical protein